MNRRTLSTAVALACVGCSLTDLGEYEANLGKPVDAESEGMGGDTLVGSGGTPSGPAPDTPTTYSASIACDGLFDDWSEEAEMLQGVSEGVSYWVSWNAENIFVRVDADEFSGATPNIEFRLYLGSRDTDDEEGTQSVMVPMTSIALPFSATKYVSLEANGDTAQLSEFQALGWQGERLLTESEFQRSAEEATIELCLPREDLAVSDSLLAVAFLTKLADGTVYGTGPAEALDGEATSDVSLDRFFSFDLNDETAPPTSPADYAAEPAR